MESAWRDSEEDDCIVRRSLAGFGPAARDFGEARARPSAPIRATHVVASRPAPWRSPDTLSSSFSSGLALARTMAAARRARPSTVLLVASVVFYLSWGWKLSILLAALTLFTYGAGHLLRTRKTHRKAILAGSIGVILGTLATFKYAAFFASFVPGLHVAQLLLPIGISFYVFHSISLPGRRVSRRRQSLPNIIDFAAFLALFPATRGRARSCATRIWRRSSRNASTAGSCSTPAGSAFLIGLSMKVLIADSVAPLADAMFSVPNPTLAESWLGALAYTMQLYFDFAGYSAMAIGLALMIGFRFAENFNMPYHQPLDHRVLAALAYLAHRVAARLPLHPARRQSRRRGPHLRNLFLVMMLGGLWHGARLRSRHPGARTTACSSRCTSCSAARPAARAGGSTREQRRLPGVRPRRHAAPS